MQCSGAGPAPGSAVRDRRYKTLLLSANPIRHALRGDFTRGEIFNLAKIHRWFLVRIKAIVDFEEELAGAKNSESAQ